MITYDEFINYLRSQEDYTDTELAVAMYCIEDDYGDYMGALESNGYEEDDPDTWDDALFNTADEYRVQNEYGDCYSCNGAEYLVYDSYEYATSEAIQSAKDIIEDCGYTCVNGWEDYVDEEWFEEAIREMNESYAEDIESEGDFTFDNRLVQECYDNDLIDDEDFELDDDGEPDYTQCTVDSYELQEMLAEYMTNDAIGYGAVRYYISNFGEEDFNEAVKQHDLVDIDALAEYCVDEDGVAHYLASYDGNENEIDFNGVTYYLFRCN